MEITETVLLNTYKIILQFNDEIFDEKDLSFFYHSTKQNKYIEFLPGIYYKEQSIKQQGCLQKIINNLTKKSLVKLVSFRIYNTRDLVKLFIDNKLFYENSSAISIHPKLIFDNKGPFVKKVFKEVETKDILYPFISGGSGSRCAIKGIFLNLNLLNHPFKGYPFFTEYEMYSSTSKKQDLLCLCKSFKPCMNLLHDFQNGLYLYPTADNHSDNLHLIECNGIYKISNANHRICCAKRFGIKTIIAEVDIYTGEKFLSSQSVLLPERQYEQLNTSNIDILTDFYGTIHKLGLNQKDAAYIITNGLRNAELIDYINKRTGKPLYELTK